MTFHPDYGGRICPFQYLDITALSWGPHWPGKSGKSRGILLMVREIDVYCPICVTVVLKKMEKTNNQ